MAVIRKGTSDDLNGALKLIRELAEYEKAPEAVENTVQRMHEDGFGDKPVFEFFVAEEAEEVVGLALYYYGYSTWKGRFLYLEDLIVTASYRGKGLGKHLFDAIMFKAKEEGVALVGWQVLDWNEPAIDFYKKLGASLHPEWVNCRLYKEQINAYEVDAQN